MFFNFEIAYKYSVYGDNSKSYIKFIINILCTSKIRRGIRDDPFPDF